MSNNTFLINLSAGNINVANSISIKPFEMRDGYPHGVRFGNTNPVSFTFPLTLANTGVYSGINANTAMGINSTSLFIGNNETLVINAANRTVPLLTVGGISFNGILGNLGVVNTQIFTANGTWNKPPGLTGNEQVLVMMWGGGGGYVSNTFGGFTYYYSGGGGACIVASRSLNSFSSSEDVIVGGGGTTGVNGGNSTFSGMNALGGTAATAFTSGGGAGLIALGSGDNGGEPLGGTAFFVGGINGGLGTFGGGGAGLAGGASIFGGGGGGYNDTTGGTPHNTGVGGASIYGGVGGSGGNNTIATSIFAPSIARGGTINFSAVGTDGIRGEVRVWVTSLNSQ